MHAFGYDQIRFLHSSGHRNFQLSARRARSHTIENSCLSLQPNRMKAQNVHFCCSVLSQHFTVTTTVTPVIDDRPNTFICNRVDNSKAQCLVIIEVHGSLSERNELTAWLGCTVNAIQGKLNCY